jgi:hypothetical protein
MPYGLWPRNVNLVSSYTRKGSVVNLQLQQVVKAA